MNGCFLETGALALWDGEFEKSFEELRLVKADSMPRRHLYLSRGGYAQEYFDTRLTNFHLNRTQQGIYYEVTGTQPSRQVTFEFYLSHIEDAGQYYQ